MNFGLFENHILEHFDFTKEYVGYVIDNSEFEENFSIKVFIPELFGYQYEEYIQAHNEQTTTNIEENEITINFNNEQIINIDELDAKNSIIKTEYIVAKILIERHSFNSYDNFIFCNKPDVGRKVLVKFLNDNPSNCIYTNTLFLSENENPTMYINSKNNTISDGNTATNGKVYWVIK